MRQMLTPDKQLFVTGSSAKQNEREEVDLT